MAITHQHIRRRGTIRIQFCKRCRTRVPCRKWDRMDCTIYPGPKIQGRSSLDIKMRAKWQIAQQQEYAKAMTLAACCLLLGNGGTRSDCCPSKTPMPTHLIVDGSSKRSVTSTSLSKKTSFLCIMHPGLHMVSSLFNLIFVLLWHRAAAPRQMGGFPLRCTASIIAAGEIGFAPQTQSCCNRMSNADEVAVSTIRSSKPRCSK